MYLFLSHAHRWGTHEEKSRRNRGTRAVSPTHAAWAPTRDRLCEDRKQRRVRWGANETRRKIYMRQRHMSLPRTPLGRPHAKRHCVKIENRGAHAGAPTRKDARCTWDRDTRTVSPTHAARAPTRRDPIWRLKTEACTLSISHTLRGHSN